MEELINHFTVIQKILPAIFKDLSPREEDVLTRRYGLREDIIQEKRSRQTLQTIGNHYHITRERVRQIENFAIRKIKQSKAFKNEFANLKSFVVATLEDCGGTAEERFLVKELVTRSHGFDGVDEKRTAVLKQIFAFMLSVLLTDVIENLRNRANFKRAWKLKDANFDLANKAIDVLIDIVTKEDEPLAENDLLGKFKKTPFYIENQKKLEDKKIVACLHLSSNLDYNVFGEWGIASWGLVALKTVNDKIHYILKKHKKPLHFSEITDFINKKDVASFFAHGATVRNILTAEDRYILVGRGIYALAEWGVEAGTVTDLIANILKKVAGAVSRDDIIDEVLKQRLVKRQTVLVALNNTKKFVKIGEDTYTLKK